jgi:hypothetical protein
MALARDLQFDRAEAVLRELPPDGEQEEIRQKALALIHQVQAELAALPPERADEPLATRVRRAESDDRLGRSYNAMVLWRSIAEAPDATLEQVRRAAGYLAFKGDSADAERALARLRGLVGENPEVEILERVIQDRFSS